MILDTQIKRIRKDGKTLYACKNNCGNYISRINSLCQKCSFEKRGIRKHSELPAGTIIKGSHAYYPCINNCGAFVRRKNGLCRKCSNLKRRKLHTCNICGKPVKRKTERCWECYLKSIQSNKKQCVKKHKTYPCKKCGNPAIKPDYYCKSCLDRIMLILGERKQDEINRRIAEKERRLLSKHKHIKKQICTKSPDGNHFEIITENIGVCKYCGRTKDYNELLKPYLPAIGL